jgi:uncharacterized protein (DUF427 family)
MSQQTTSKIIRTPGADHPITISENPRRVIVRAGGRVVADSRRALTLREAHYPPVQYIPREDVDMAQLQRTEHATWCPYKGDCAYYSVPAAGSTGVNAAWTYEAPHAAVTRIGSHLAFYPGRVEAIEERAD